MAITLHALTARHLSGALLLASTAGAAAAVLLRDRLGYELLVAVGWNVAVLIFTTVMLRVTSRFTETQMAHKVRHRAPGSLLLGGTALCAALFGIYSIMLLVTATADTGGVRALHLVVALLTTVLSWSLVHLLFALEYAKLYYIDAAEPDRIPGGLEFPGGHRPDYGDLLYFSFIIGVACQTADVDISSRPLRKMALLHGILAFVFNTVILAATINVAAGLG